MAYEEGLVTITLKAGAAIPRYSVVSVDANGDVVATPLAGTSASILGVSQNEVTVVGEAVTVAIGGVSKAIAGAAVTVANPVAVSTTAGRLADLGAAKATKYVVGLALSTQATAGKYFNLLIQPERNLDTVS